MARYDALVKSGQLKPDEHQTRIVQKLERLYKDVLAYKPPALPSLEHVAPQRSLVRLSCRCRLPH
jgi:protein AFG1